MVGRVSPLLPRNRYSRFLCPIRRRHGSDSCHGPIPSAIAGQSRGRDQAARGRFSTSGLHPCQMSHLLRVKPDVFMFPLRKAMRFVTWLCIASNGTAGLIAIVAAFEPYWFYSSGDESMAWGIELTETGLGLTVAGLICASFTGKGKWKRFWLNFLFVLCWVVAETIRVSLGNP